MANVIDVTARWRADTSEAVKELNKLKEATKKVGQAADDAGDKVDKIGKGDGIGSFRRRARMDKATEDMKRFGKETSKATVFVRKLGRSVIRIAWYRALRALIAGITKGIKEGTTNLYEWAKIVGDDFGPRVYNLGNSWKYLKNQIGAATGTLLSAWLGGLDNLITKIANAITWVSKLFAFLSGQSFYYEAVKSTKTLSDQMAEDAASTKDATKAAKEFKKQLMGFDQINNITDTSGSDSGSGSNSGSNSSGVDAGSFVKKELGDWGQSSSLLMSIKDVLFDWSDLTGEQIAEKIIAGLTTLAMGVAGFLITGSLTGGLLFGLTGLAMGLAIDSLVFNHDGKISAKEILRLAMTAIFGVVGGVLGWTLGGPQGALIGFSVGATIGATIQKFLFSSADEITVKDFWTMIITALGVGIGLIVGGPVGAAIGLGASLIINAGIKLALKNKKKADKPLKEWWDDVKKNWKDSALEIKVKLQTAGAKISKGWQNLIDFFKDKKKQTFTFDFQAKFSGAIDEIKEAWNSIKDGTKDIKLNASATISKASKDILNLVKKVHGYSRTFKRSIKVGAEWVGKAKEKIDKIISAWRLKDKVLSFSLKFSAAVSDLKSWVNTNVIKRVNDKFAKVPILKNHLIPYLATGGMVDTGQLFIARESGPEMVGTMNGKTTVANNQQIIDGISQGVYKAMMAANNGNKNNVSVTLEGDAKNLFKVVQKEAKSYAAKTGSYAFG